MTTVWREEHTGETYCKENIDADEECFCRWEWYLVGKYKIYKQTRAQTISRAYQASNFAKDASERMDDLNDGTKAVDQFSIFVPIVFECRFSVLKQPEDVFGGVAYLKFVGGRMIREVYPGLSGVVVQCGIENRSKSRG